MGDRVTEHATMATHEPPGRRTAPPSQIEALARRSLPCAKPGCDLRAVSIRITRGVPAPLCEMHRTDHELNRQMQRLKELRHRDGGRR
jgi:hypothetical protein